MLRSAFVKTLHIKSLSNENEAFVTIQLEYGTDYYFGLWYHQFDHEWKSYGVIRVIAPLPSMYLLDPIFW